MKSNLFEVLLKQRWHKHNKSQFSNPSWQPFVPHKTISWHPDISQTWNLYKWTGPEYWVFIPPSSGCECEFWWWLMLIRRNVMWYPNWGWFIHQYNLIQALSCPLSPLCRCKTHWLPQIWHLMMAGEEVVLSSDSDLLMARDTFEALEGDQDQDQVSQMWGAETQNLLALSILLGLALVTNLSAAPVILFRRTRWVPSVTWPSVISLVTPGLVTASSRVWSSAWPSRTWSPRCRGWWAAWCSRPGTWPGPAPAPAAPPTTSSPPGCSASPTTSWSASSVCSLSRGHQGSSPGCT